MPATNLAPYQLKWNLHMLCLRASIFVPSKSPASISTETSSSSLLSLKVLFVTANEIQYIEGEGSLFDMFCVNPSKRVWIPLEPSAYECCCCKKKKTPHTSFSLSKSLESSQNHCFCRNILLEVKMNMKRIDRTIRRIANHSFLIYLFIYLKSAQPLY